MKRLGSARRVLCAAVAAVGLSLGAGCVENDQSIIIAGNYALTADCAVPSSMGTVVARGRFDIGLGSSINNGYRMIPTVYNALPPTAGMSSGGGGGG